MEGCGMEGYGLNLPDEDIDSPRFTQDEDNSQSLWI